MLQIAKVWADCSPGEYGLLRRTNAKCEEQNSAQVGKAEEVVPKILGDMDTSLEAGFCEVAP